MSSPGQKHGRCPVHGWCPPLIFLSHPCLLLSMLLTGPLVLHCFSSSLCLLWTWFQFSSQSFNLWQHWLLFEEPRFSRHSHGRAGSCCLLRRCSCTWVLEEGWNWSYPVSLDLDTSCEAVSEAMQLFASWARVFLSAEKGYLCPPCRVPVMRFSFCLNGIGFNTSERLPNSR